MSRLLRAPLLPLVALALVGCEPPDEGPEAPSLGTLTSDGAPITLDHTAVIAFQADWSEVVTVGPVMAGGRLRVEYDPARLPSCRATKYGLPAWNILLNWDFGAGSKSVALSQKGAVMEATVDVPEDAKSISLWFLNSDYYGCKQWDSNLGVNYVWDVQPPAQVAVLAFTADWQEVASSPVQQGALLRIDYAAERLTACRHAPNGQRAWSIYASWRFLPGGQSASLELTEGAAGALTKPQVSVPQGATSVELWFSNSDTTGCVAWDSNFGANYSFPVAPAGNTPQVGWAGDWDFVKVGKQPQHLGKVDPAYYFDSWQGMPLSSQVEVQVWIPGVTDKAYPSADAARAAAESLIVAQAVTDGLSGPVGGWGTRPMPFERQQGNNFVFAFRLGELRWQTAGLNVPDGLWRWYARFSTDGGASWFEAGKDPGPRRYVLAKTQDCSLFPDQAPPECPQGKAVGWAGDWGRYASHACWFTQDLPDPLVLTKSAVGHDCMTVTADVWVPGLTDAGGSPGSILAQVETNVAYGGGPLATPVTYPLTFDQKVGNNYRYAWTLGQLVGMADRDDYTFRFRFSADGGKTWKILGKGDGPAAPWRSLHVRNDSQDVEVTQLCEGIWSWSAASASFPSCIEWQPTVNQDAACELWLNALGRGQWSHNGVSLGWLEAWIRVQAPGQVLGVGMWVKSKSKQGVVSEAFSFGAEVEPGYWLTGFTTKKSADGTDQTPLAFAFFADVAAGGTVKRLWQSAGGANYTVEGAFAVPGYVKGIGSGSIEYADESVGLFAPKHACVP
ncbi:MAG: hypothetical protein AMXMBFR64_04780 [Myxococcales bacterium]